jgi:hypothetical protein
MQTTLEIVSLPQPFLEISVIVYWPADEKDRPKFVEPHVLLLFDGFVLPRVPLTMLHPVLGETVQLNGVVVLQVPKLSTVTPATEVFVNVSVVLMHVAVSGLMVNLAFGLIDVVMGSMVRSEKPHGFCALILILNVLGVFPPIAPQDVFVNVCE